MKMFHVKHFPKERGDSLKKRIFALFIVLLMLFGATGCENVEYPDESSQISGNGNEESVDLMEELPDIVPEGEVLEKRDFVIATNDKSIFVNDENSPGTINKAVKERNQLIKNKYGAQIKVKVADYKTISADIVLAAASGRTYCDMISISASDTARLYAEGLLYDMNTFPDFDLSSNYFDEKNAKSLATNNSLYLLADPITLYYDEIYSVFYNRELLEKSGCENPETLAAQGKWTWDKFKEIEKTVAFEVMNKAAADLEKDTFGFSAYYGEGTNPIVLWTSCGNKMIDNTYKNKVDFTLDVEKAVEIGNYIKGVNNSKAKLPFDGDKAASVFEEGRLAFLIHRLGYINSLRDGSEKGSNFGLLPMPKYNAEQENYSGLVSNSAKLISVPKTMANADPDHKRFVSAVIAGICAHGGYEIKNAYLNDTVVKMLNNNSEAVMLDLVMESAVFDFSYVFGSQISAVRNVSTGAVCRLIDVGLDLRENINGFLDKFREYADSNFV